MKSKKKLVSDISKNPDYQDLPVKKTSQDGITKNFKDTLKTTNL